MIILLILILLALLGLLPLALMITGAAISDVLIAIGYIGYQVLRGLFRALPFILFACLYFFMYIGAS